MHPRVQTILLTIVLWSTAALAQPALQPVVEPSVDPVVLQEQLPALAARAEVARARSEAAQAWFSGTGELGEAFPELAGAPVLDPSAVRGRLAAIADARRARALERVSPPPNASPAVAARHARALADALDAEAAAELQLERVLLGVSTSLQRAPGLADAPVAEQVASLRAQRAQIAAAHPDELPAEAAAQIAALDAAEQQLHALRRHALAAATVPGTTALADAVRADLEVLPDSTAARSARLDRLRRVAPLLTGDLAQDVETALGEADQAMVQHALQDAIARRDRARTALEQVPTERGEASVAALDEEAATAREAVVAARRDAEATPEETRDPDRQAMLAAGLEAAEAELALVEARLQKARTLASAEGEDGAATSERAETARQAAEEAQAAADAENQRQTALGKLKQRVAELRQATADLYESEATRRQTALDQLEALRRELDARVEALAAAESLPPLDRNRRRDIDQAYLDLRDSVAAAYLFLDTTRRVEWEARTDAATRLEEIRSGRRWSASTGSADLAALNAERNDAVAALTEALERRATNLEGEQDAAYALLDRARDERRRARREASTGARSQARRDFLPELWRELTAIPGQLAAAGRQLVGVAFELPTRLLDLGALFALFMRSIELVLLGGAWWLARQRAASWVPAAWTWMWQRLRHSAVDDAINPPPPDAAVPLTRDLLDILLGAVLLSWLTPQLPALGVLALVWVVRASWNAAPKLATAVLATPTEPRMAVRIVTSRTRDLVAWTLRVVVAWWGAQRTAAYVALWLLDADRLRDVVATAATAAAVVLAAWALVRWGETIRSAVQHHEEQDNMTRWLHRAPRPGPIGAVLQTPRSALSLALLSWRAVARQATRLVEGRAGLGWLQAALARRQVRQEEETTPRVALPDETVAAVRSAGHIDLDRPAVIERLREAYTAWQAEQRRGVVSLSGEHGSGKTAILADLEEAFGPARPVIGGQVPQRINTAAEALGWLATVFGVDPTPDADMLAERIAAVPSKVVLLDDIQRLFLRCVGGTAPLREVVSVVLSTSNTHFYVLAAHGWSWSYLRGISARLRLDAFRDHVELEPVGDQALMTWLEGRTTSAGLTLSWDALMDDSSGADRSLVERRARTAYYRLLADAALGNPEVALGYHLTALCRSEVDGVAQVRMFESPSPADIASLNDDLLLVLTALTLHDGATTTELAAALNRRTGSTRAACRQLEGIGVVSYEPTDTTYTVQVPWRPAVARLLRQKHFLHWS